MVLSKILKTKVPGKGMLFASLSLLAVLASLTSALVPAQSASALSVQGVPDPWIYCANTVPRGQTTTIYYGGIFARPNYNSQNTMCRDIVQNSWFWWTQARSINWNLACKWGTNGMFPYAYLSNGVYLCRK